MNEKLLRQRVAIIAERLGININSDTIEQLRGIAVEELGLEPPPVSGRSMFGSTISMTSSGVGEGIPTSSVRRILSFDEFSNPFSTTNNNNSNRNMQLDTQLVEELTQKMKTKHLQKRERDAIHQPKSDYYEGSRGEECKNACSLEVEDLVIKFK